MRVIVIFVGHMFAHVLSPDRMNIFMDDNSLIFAGMIIYAMIHDIREYLRD